VSELPEQRRADALKLLAAEGVSRTEVLRTLDGWTERVRKAVLAALEAGVTVRRAAEVGGVSPDTVQRWSNQAKTEQGAEQS
jgi:DNA-directed RNA polymerase specialized sigma24 family protein